MCVNKRWIKNPYSNKDVLVKCGHCEACLQEKANKRAARCRYTFSEKYSSLFITLDYQNKYVPYIKRCDIFALKSGVSYLPVYRDFIPKHSREYLYDRVPKLRGKGFKKIHKKDSSGNNLFVEKIKDVPCGEFARVPINIPLRDINRIVDSFNLPDMATYNGYDVKDKIAVCWYPDFQKFMKRLRKYLKENYNYDSYCKYFACTENGDRKKRSHNHALLYFERGKDQIFRYSIHYSWPYCDWSPWRTSKKLLTTYKGVERYVSSYVNCLQSLPELLQGTSLAPSWHYSHDFGCEFPEFSFEKIRERVYGHNLRFPLQINRNKSLASIYVPIPAYVGNRYFPVYKGHSSVNYSQHSAILYFALRDKGDGREFMRECERFGIYHTLKSAKTQSTTIRNKFINLYFNYKISFNEYCYLHYNFWLVRASNLIRWMHESENFKNFDTYDNIIHYVYYKTSGFLENVDVSNVETDYNKFERNIREHNRLIDDFNHRELIAVENSAFFEDKDI